MANGLGRWMDGMQEGMGHQGHIAARVKLIEVQIEGFKVCMCAWGNQEQCLRITALTYNHYPNMLGPRGVQITEMFG